MRRIPATRVRQDIVAHSSSVKSKVLCPKRLLGRLPGHWELGKWSFPQGTMID